MSYVYAAALSLVLIGLYAVIVKDNLIKKLVGFVVATNGIHLFLVSVGYRAAGVSPMISEFGASASFVDPLPQALVLTSIVISLSTLALALALCVTAFRRFGSVRTSVIRGLRG